MPKAMGSCILCWFLGCQHTQKAQSLALILCRRLVPTEQEILLIMRSFFWKPTLVFCSFSESSLRVWKSCGWCTRMSSGRRPGRTHIILYGLFYGVRGGKIEMKIEACFKADAIRGWEDHSDTIYEILTANCVLRGYIATKANPRQSF